MAAGDGLVPDWRDPAAYRPLLDADRSLIAWEWLRRDPAYRAAAERSFERAGSRERGDPNHRPERWGLHAFELPALAAPHARPVWTAAVHPYVLGVDACAPLGGGDFDLRELGTMATLVTGLGRREHLLISDGLRAIRIDVHRGSLGQGPVQLHCRFEGLARAEAALLALRRLVALSRTGRFSAGLHPAAARAGRLVLLLRAHDALMRGATQREIAAALLGGGAGEARWRVTAPTLRSQVQRLAKGARAMAAGGYLKLLGS